MAAGHGVALRVLGNKVADADDVAWLRGGGRRRAAGLPQRRRPGCGRPSAARVAPVSRLEPENLAVLGSVLAALDARERDWAAYHARPSPSTCQRRGVG